MPIYAVDSNDVKKLGEIRDREKDSETIKLINHLLDKLAKKFYKLDKEKQKAFLNGEYAFDISLTTKEAIFLQDKGILIQPVEKKKKIVVKEQVVTPLKEVESLLNRIETKIRSPVGSILIANLSYIGIVILSILISLYLLPLISFLFLRVGYPIFVFSFGGIVVQQTGNPFAAIIAMIFSIIIAFIIFGILYFIVSIIASVGIIVGFLMVLSFLYSKIKIEIIRTRLQKRIRLIVGIAVFVVSFIIFYFFISPYVEILFTLSGSLTITFPEIDLSDPTTFYPVYELIGTLLLVITSNLVFFIMIITLMSLTMVHVSSLLVDLSFYYYRKKKNLKLEKIPVKFEYEVER